MKNCSFSIVFSRQASEHSLVNLARSGRSANLCSYSRNRFPVRLHQSEKFDFLSTFLVASTLFPDVHPLRVSPYTSSFRIPAKLSLHISATVDTELIDGNNYHLNGFVAAIEMKSRPSFSFVLQICSLDNTGSPKNKFVHSH